MEVRNRLEACNGRSTSARYGFRTSSTPFLSSVSSTLSSRPGVPVRRACLDWLEMGKILQIISFRSCVVIPFDCPD